MHDDTQVARVIVMGNALKHGQFPVRWVSDLGYGYGYPLYNFYGPLPYYLGGSLYAFGVDSVMATKWMFGVGTILASVTMFIFLYPILGLLSSITGSMIFLYAPYHAVQIFIRGSVGEYWAIACVPLIFSGIWYIYHNRYTKGGIIGSLGLAGAILSHTILGFITTGIIGILVLILFLKKRDWHFLMMFMLGLGMSAFFWLPALVEMRYTSVEGMISSSTTSFSDHYICPSQLWNAPWGYAGSAQGCADGMSLKIGKFHIIVFILSLFILFLKRSVRRLRHINVFIFVVIACTVCSIFLTLPYASFIWNMFPMTRFIQYPWRLLSFVTLGMGIVSAYIVVSNKAPITRFFCMAALVVGAILVNAKLFVPQYQFLRDSYQFETVEELRFRMSKISDEYMPKDFVRPMHNTDIVRDVISSTPSLTVQEVKKTEVSMIYEVISNTPQNVLLKIAYFPGWMFWVNGMKVTPTITSNLPYVKVARGKSTIEMKFINTPVRTAANYLSILSILVCMLYYAYGNKTNA
jgi:hypothetical protein